MPSLEDVSALVAGSVEEEEEGLEEGLAGCPGDRGVCPVIPRAHRLIGRQVAATSLLSSVIITEVTEARHQADK